MAVDETLLESAIHLRTCTLRWYRWSEATLSLGYFQQADEAVEIPEFRSLPKVRRLSGGGAILHHYEWTYSCALPCSEPSAIRPVELYAFIHEAIIAVLRRRGIRLCKRDQVSGRQTEPFLCFGRADPNDVVLRGHKVLGSAQRRRRGAILQHGALLLRRSPLAPQHLGILDLSPDALFDRDLFRDVAFEIGHCLARDVVVGSLSQQEQNRIAELEQTRYRFLDWRKNKPSTARRRIRDD